MAKTDKAHMLNMAALSWELRYKNPDAEQISWLLLFRRAGMPT